MLALEMAVISLIFVLILFVYTVTQNKNLKESIEELKKLVEKTSAPSQSPLSMAVEPPVEKTINPELAVTPSSVAEEWPESSLSGGQFSEKLKKWSQELFFTTMGLAKTGGVILFLGMVFLTKLAANNGYFPLNARLIAIASLAVLLFGIGAYLTKKRRDYAVLLMGIGFALAYLLIFASYFVFSVLPLHIALVLAIVTSIICIITSILINHELLALCGLMGAFVASILLHRHQEHYLFVFSYYLILNLAVLTLAWLREWYRITWVGFIFTFMLGVFWFWRMHMSLWQAELYLNLFYAIYFVVPLFNLRKSRAAHQHVPLARLIIINSIITFLIQSALLKSHVYWHSAELALMSCLYLTVYVFSQKCDWIRDKTFKQMMLTLSFIMFSLIFPVLFSFKNVGFIWCLQSCLFIWLGLKQKNYLVTLLGVAQQFITVSYLLFLLLPFDYEVAYSTIFSGIVTWITVILSSYLMTRHIAKESFLRGVNVISFIVAQIYFLLIGWLAVRYFAPAHYTIFSALVGLAIFTAICSIIQRFSRFQYIEKMMFVLPVITLLFNVIGTYFVSQYYLVLGFGLAYLAALVHMGTGIYKSQLATLIWLIILTSLFQMFYYHPDWTDSLYFTACLDSALLGLGVFYAMRYLLIQRYALPPLLLTESVVKPLNYAVAALLIINPVMSPLITPAHFQVLINPIDLSLLCGLFILWLTKSIYMSHLKPESTRSYSVIMVSVLFMTINGIVLRSLSFYEHIPYHLSNIMQSFSIQLTLTFIWSIAGCVAILLASRKSARGLWLTGMVIIIITVIKLFLVDLAQFNAMLRVISFIGVGILLLILGFFAKVPAKNSELLN